MMHMRKLKYIKDQIIDNTTRDSAVGIATGYRLDGRGVQIRFPVCSRIVCSPQRPDRLWDSPSFLSNGYDGLIPRD
jgi:hypothetical protein